MTAPARSEDAVRRNAFVVASVAAGAFLLTSVFFTLPSNVLSHRDGSAVRTFFTTLAPQNWAFFTRDPQSQEVVAYAIHDGALKNLMKTPQVRASNLFGITRIQRAQGVEIGEIYGSQLTWATCSDRWAQCMEQARAQKTQVIQNGSPVATVCGDVILVVQETTPWEFKDLYSDPVRIDRFAHLSSECVDG